MPTPNTNQTRWTVSVSKETDIALRCFLAQRGLKEGDMSKFIEESVNFLNKPDFEYFAETKTLAEALISCIDSSISNISYPKLS